MRDASPAAVIGSVWVKRSGSRARQWQERKAGYNDREDTDFGIRPIVNPPAIYELFRRHLAPSQNARQVGVEMDHAKSQQRGDADGDLSDPKSYGRRKVPVESP
jgi:hypothetical protein